jgi:prepilin-type N-terminal cleavage/methylation domain-containing protein
MKIESRISQSGFTVTEMVVVMAIIGILTVIALTTFGHVREKGRIAVIRNNINIIDDALAKFAQKHQGRYPGLTDWPIVNYPPIAGRLKGNRIIGGNSGPKDADPVFALATVNQDDYLDDTKPDSSPFRSVLPSRYSNYPAPMRAIDALYEENLLIPYPDNPLRPPGTSMVNVAYTLGSFQKNINIFSLQPIIGVSSIAPIGLAAGRPMPAPGTNPPSIRPLPYRYSIFAYM